MPLLNVLMPILLQKDYLIFSTSRLSVIPLELQGSFILLYTDTSSVHFTWQVLKTSLWLSLYATHIDIVLQACVNVTENNSSILR